MHLLMIAKSPAHKQYLKYLWFMSLIKSQPGEFQAYNAKDGSVQTDSRNMGVGFQRKKTTTIVCSEHRDLVRCFQGKSAGCLQTVWVHPARGLIYLR